MRGPACAGVQLYGMSYEEMRRVYNRGELHEGDLTSDPLGLFTSWMGQAVESGELEPNAVALATVSDSGQPHVRFVLLKDASPAGFVFYTNYESLKGRDLAAAPVAALAFWWPKLERQVRVEGRVSKLPAADSDAYFRSRPRGSQLSARASRQSEPLANHEALAAEVARLDAEFPTDVPRPKSWGGYVLAPERMEFWQGRRDRLHDRFEYLREVSSERWSVRRLSP